MSSNQICNIIRSENLMNNNIYGISFEWDADWWLHVHGTQKSTSAWGVTSQKTPIHLEAGEYFLSAEVEGGGLGTYSYFSVWLTDDSRAIGSTYGYFSVWLTDDSRAIGSGPQGYPRYSNLSLSVTEPVDVYVCVNAGAKGATVDYRMRFMLVEGTTPAAWAPAEGETLSGGSAQMSANLLGGITPTLASGTTESDGVWRHAARTNTSGHDDWLRYDLAGQSALATNQTYHVGLSTRGASANSASLHATIGYQDAAGNVNWATSGPLLIGTSWGRAEATIVVPSGMTPFGFYVAAYGTCPETWMTAATLSYGSPVPLASSAHTPYATQDHLRSEYATKAALKVTSDAVTAEVTERGKLAGRVGTLESTSGTHASRLEQLASSIKSLVKGESTYTDPDGKSATSGIYSLVTQTRDSVTALFGSYTKTADLASTQAVKDAKKAGTDAQAAASAAQTTADSAKSTAQAAASDAATAKTNAASAVSTANSASTSAASAVKTANAASSTASSANSTANSAASTASAAKSTADAAKTSAASAVKTANSASSTASSAKSTADSLATMIREDATGITVGKSADGKTYSTGRTHMTADSFDVLDKAGNVLSSFGKSLIELGKNSKDATISMLAGLARIKATSAGVSDGAWCVMSTDEFISVEGYHASRLAAGYKDDSGFIPQGVAEVMVQGGEGDGGVMMYAGAHGSEGNSFAMSPNGYALNHPEYMLKELFAAGESVADLNACGPGVFSYNASTANRPNTYGVCLSFVAGSGNWLFQVALPTGGDPHWRRNINGGGWTSWWTITSQ